MKPNSRIAFALDLVSFFVQKLPEEDLASISSIVLFGSSARREAAPDSDLDLFVETDRETSLRSQMKTLQEEFLSSVKVTRYWALLATPPEIQLVIGRAQDHEHLAAGLLADGIVLYGRYRGIEARSTPMVLMTWTLGKRPGTQTNLYRNLYGYRARGKSYPGLVARFRARKLNPGSLLVPLEAAAEFRKLFRSYKVRVLVRNVAVY